MVKVLDTNQRRIVQSMKNLLHYYDVTRGCGHTALALAGTHETPCAFMAASLPIAMDLTRYDVDVVPCTLRTLTEVHGKHGRHLPLVLDNSAIIQLVQESLSVIEALAKEE
jgi:hypothetical protein